MMPDQATCPHQFQIEPFTNQTNFRV